MDSSLGFWRDKWDVPELPEASVSAGPCCAAHQAPRRLGDFAAPKSKATIGVFLLSSLESWRQSGWGFQELAETGVGVGG